MANERAKRWAAGAVAFVAAAAVAGGVGTAHGAEPAAPVRARPVQGGELPDAQLKRVYLACSSAAQHGALASSDIPFCSLVYEALLQRTFGGDFMALLAWSRSAQHVPQPPRRAGD